MILIKTLQKYSYKCKQQGLGFAYTFD